KGLKKLQQTIKDSPMFYADWWKQFQEIQDRCQYLFRECLAFMQGALIRVTALDNGLCQIADSLIKVLNHRAGNLGWDRLTVLADAEFYRDMADIIRLRFPGMNIWNLPVVAHEFGHYAGPQLSERQADGTLASPFQEMLKNAREKAKRRQG